MGGKLGLLHISIHAPARGATFQVFQNPGRELYFNSRPCERGDGQMYNVGTSDP